MAVLPCRQFMLTCVCLTCATASFAQNERTSPPAAAIQDETVAIHPENAVDPGSIAATGTPAAPGAPSANDQGLVLPAGGPDVDCVCSARFNVGDRVVSTVDMPDGNAQIRIGDSGTVVCGREFGANDLILVRWDITNGHDGFDLCTCPAQELPDGSARGWYVFCDELAVAADNTIDCVCQEEYYIGQTVVAAIDNPDGNPQILAGDIGTVICGREFLLGGLILVSWDISNGHDGFAACDCPGDELPSGSNNGWYVHCDDIHGVRMIDLCTCSGLITGRTVVATENNPSGQSQVFAGEQGTIVCGNEPPATLPVLIAWDTATGHDGNGFCDCPGQQLPSGSDSGWWVQCAEVRQINPLDIDCVCPGQFDRGDKVVSLIDNNGGNAQLDAGHVGTVICGREFGASDLILVAWDINNGHDGFDSCTCPGTELPDGSETGWYVFCNTIAAVGDGPVDCVCGADFQPGDQIRVTVDNPDGNAQILAGDTGTVICGREFGTGVVLVAWDITNGHDGFDACSCPTNELPGGSITGWYVFCNEMSLISDCPGDIDGSGVTGFPDLLRVLNNWGSCVGCPEDLDDDGLVGFSDLLVVISQWGPC